MPTQSKKPAIVESTQDARAGVTGHHARGVLVASLVGAILVMIVIAAITLR